MSREQVIQSPEGTLVRIPVVGIMDAYPAVVGAYTGNGVPVNGLVSYATGCLWRNPKGTYGSLTQGLLWINIGTNNSSQWTNIDSLLPLTPPNSLVTLTGNTTMTPAANGGRTMLLNNTAGLTVTLPTATGSGVNYNFFSITTPTTGNYVIQVTSDVISGVGFISETAGPLTTGFLTGAATHTITMNGTTQGGILGAYVEVRDVGTAQWALKMATAGSGTIVTPFS